MTTGRTWRYAAAFIGAAFGAVVGGVIGALVGVGIGTAAAEDFMAWGGGMFFAGLGLVGGAPLGLCVGWWHALNLTGGRPRPATSAILAGLVVAAALGAIAVVGELDDTVLVQAMLGALQPLTPLEAVLGLMLAAGALGALACALGERAR